jgi:hypothetical protein
MHIDFHPFHAWTRAWIVYLKWISPSFKIIKMYKTSLTRIAVEAEERATTTLPTWCPSPQWKGRKADTSYISAAYKTEILKAIAFWLIDIERARRCTPTSDLFSIFPRGSGDKGDLYFWQYLDTMNDRCIKCKRSTPFHTLQPNKVSDYLMGKLFFYLLTRHNSGYHRMMKNL